LGACVVGRIASLMAAGLGCDVTLTDISLPTLRYVADVMPKNVKTLYSSRHNIEQELPTVDLVIGSVLVPGAKAPKLLTADMLPMMRPGTVIVDVAVDQGGCFETTHPTTHSEPIYTMDGIVHYAVANIPGAVPYTSTLALTNATLPYALRIADMGWKEACKADAGLAEGVNVVDGKVTFKGVADAWGMPYHKLEL
ncbi:MAG: alanine dehydrogenase, partial [Muribaculaceae bacterium]|nr:alanine dehydrogenase [Muribaculaceae bacterium]